MLNRGEDVRRFGELVDGSKPSRGWGNLCYFILLTEFATTLLIFLLYIIDYQIMERMLSFFIILIISLATQCCVYVVIEKSPVGPFIWVLFGTITGE